MDIQIIIILAGVLGVAGIGALAYVFFAGSNTAASGGLRDLMSSSSSSTALAAGERRARRTPEEIEYDIEQIKKQAGATRSKKAKEDVTIKLFKAGFYTAEDRRKFQRIQLFTPFITTPLLTGLMYFVVGSTPIVTMGLIVGLFAGFAAPMSWLERQIRARQEDTMYYLPLVIEQVSIGVSSSLDIGPCIAQIVQMATERDSHNPVTEMFVHVEKLIRSGLNLEDSLMEVGEANGMTEVKHALMFLAQCSRHGGEVSKQLQELADSVMTQRQTQVEGKIAALPVKATGPLVVVFAGFFALLFAGLFVRMISAFSSTG